MFAVEQHLCEMRTTQHITGRISFQYTTIVCCAVRVSAAISAIMQFPAFFSACTPAPHARMRLASENSYTDVFFFDTLSPQMLDSYQRVPSMDELYALSSAGPKRVVALQVGSKDAAEWAGVRTYADLCKFAFRLEADSPDAPLLAGETVLEDGLSRVANMPMKTSLAMIELNSVACDFTGTPYSGQGFLNTIIYIQYAGVEARPFGPDSGIPISTLNQGWLDSTAVMALPHPEYLLSQGLGNIWRARLQQPVRFWCYGNDVEKAALGRPVTRLVLEGYVGEHHCYYPIDIPGLKAGQRYTLDVTLRRIGSPDPDIPVSSADIIVETLTVPWELAQQREVEF